MPYFRPILGDIMKHFAKSDARKRLLLLIDKDRQVEGWFKGELMLVFEQTKNLNHPRGWVPEVSYEYAPRKKCDFVLIRAKRPRWVIGLEVKTACPGPQHKRTLTKIANNDFDFEFANHRLTEVISDLVRDCKKLKDSNLSNERVCLVFVYGKENFICEILQPFFDKLHCKIQANLGDNWGAVRVSGNHDPAPIDLGDRNLLQILAYWIIQEPQVRR